MPALFDARPIRRPSRWGRCHPHTGSREAVARLRLPQNVACGFTALRSSIGGSQFSLLFVQVAFPWSADLLFAEKAVSPVEWSPCCPRTIHLPLTASPCGRLSRPRSTISQYDFHSIVRPPSPCRLVEPYKLSFEPNGSPVFTSIPLAACWRYEPREHRKPLATCATCDSAFPIAGQGRLLRSRSISGLAARSLYSGLQPTCLRFAVAATGPQATPGSRLPATLYRGRHPSRNSSTHLHGANRTDPGVRC